jgi:hypothetical protein
LSDGPPSDTMSKMMYATASTPKSEEETVTKSSTTHYNPLMITIVIILASSSLIGIGFAYMGYDSGHLSQAYGLCRDDVLSHQRMGAYHSIDETMEALKSCDADAS